MNECPICYKHLCYQTNNYTSFSPCKHEVCDTCFDKIINGSKLCPICRSSVQ
jgi:hypothetical protein